MDVADQVGQYRILRHLARGGMGDLWLAKPIGEGGTAEIVVIKQMHANLVHDRSFLEMFIDEARIASQLRHPNVVRVYELQELDGAYYMVMEYIHGQPLSALIKESRQRRVRLPVPVALGIALEVCAALGSVHTQTAPDRRPLKIVHRDITPENLIVTYQGGVKLVDFGIARATDRLHRTRAGYTKGKRSYMSPEQYMGLPVGPASDQYSLAVVLYALLTGEKLFEVPQRTPMDELTVRKRVLRPCALVPSLPAGVDEVVLRALAYDAADRYPSCEALGAAITALLEKEHLVVSAEERAALLTEWLPPPATDEGLTQPEAPAWINVGSMATTSRGAEEDVSGHETTQWGQVSGVMGMALDSALGGDPLAASGSQDVPVETASPEAETSAGRRAPTADALHEAETHPQMPSAERLADVTIAPPISTVKPGAMSAVQGRASLIVRVGTIAGATLLALVAWRLAHSTTTLPPPMVVEQLRVIASPDLLEPPHAPAPGGPAPAGPQLTITTSAPVTVSEKGTLLGPSPLRGLPMAPGKHHLRLLNAALGIDQPLDVVLPAEGEVTKKIAFAVGSVQVRSVGRAELLVDGKLVGATPRRLSLPLGAHTLELRSGSPVRSYQEKIVLRADESLVLQCNPQVSRCGRTSIVGAAR